MNSIIPEDQANTLQIMILWYHEYLIAVLNPIKCVVQGINFDHVVRVTDCTIAFDQLCLEHVL